MLVAPGLEGRLISHRLWVTDKALPLSKRMLAAYGLSDLGLNEVLKVSDFESLPVAWIYLECKVRNGRRRAQIENVVPWLETDTDGPTDDRL
jgi:hypothetical protein